MELRSPLIAMSNRLCLPMFIRQSVGKQTVFCIVLAYQECLVYCKFVEP